MTGLFPQFLVGSQNLPGNTFLSETNARDHFGDASSSRCGWPPTTSPAAT